MALLASPNFPLHLFTDVDFKLDDAAQRNHLYGGQTQVRRPVEPRWRMKATTFPANRSDYQAWSAFLNSMRGGLRDFLAYDPERPYPISYESGWGSLTVGGSPFNGTADVTAVTANTVALALLPVGFALKAGDMMGLVQGAYYGLYELAGDVTANGSGVATVSVEPSILTSLFTAAAVAHFYRPSCVMTLENWSAPRSGAPQPISFQAIQKLY